MSVLAYGTYSVLDERPSDPRYHPGRVKHPTTGADLGEPVDRLTKCDERGKKPWWHIGRGIGSDGCAYGGGHVFKTKKAALAAWES